MITLKQINAHINRGDLFSCIVVAMDKTRNKGGHMIQIPEGRLAGSAADPTPLPDRAATLVESQQAVLAGKSRNPQHHQHYTRNIRLFQDGAPTAILQKIHPPLIIEFNGDKDVVV